MSRYMWIVNPTMSPRYVQDYIEDSGYAMVPRVLTTSKRACWAMITSKEVMSWACDRFLVDKRFGPWNITACNKQYITDTRASKYLGCLAEVDDAEAKAWIAEHPDNFSLHKKGDTKIVWIPVMRNPNKMIPTGVPCQACGGTGYIKPYKRPLYRPWPLHADE